MSKDVFVFVEHNNETARKASLELLSMGRDLSERIAGSLNAVIIGEGLKELGDKLRPYSDRVIAVSNPDLKEYSSDTYVNVLDQIMQKYRPYIMLASSTATGKDLFPRIAARLDTAYLSDAVGIDVTDDGLRIKKPLFGGKIMSWAVCKDDKPVVVAFRPNTFSIDLKESSGEYVEETFEVKRDERVKIVKREKASAKNVDLQEADFIICGGRGMKEPGNFEILEEVAQLMNGRVGASRAVVDSKWRDYDDQIGKSGKTVSPKLYIGCGVSGALHHVMGMDTSKIIVAINKDENAPIFQYADYGIIDDVFEVLPHLKEELKKAQEES